MFYFYSQVDKTARINSVHKYFIIITLLYWIFLSSVLTFVYFYQFRILILFAHCYTNSEKAITIRVTHFVLSFNVLVIEIARACMYEANCNFIAFNFTYGQHVISIRETRTFSRTLQYIIIAILTILSSMESTRSKFGYRIECSHEQYDGTIDRIFNRISENGKWQLSEKSFNYSVSFQKSLAKFTVGGLLQYRMHITSRLTNLLTQIKNAIYLQEAISRLSKQGSLSMSMKVQIIQEHVTCISMNQYRLGMTNFLHF